MKVFSTPAILLALAAPTQAAYNLQITEVWAGQSGADMTKDWIEITNYGDTLWDANSDPLKVDDNSFSLGSSALVVGLTTILPGQSAIVLMEATAADVTTFVNTWAPFKPQNPSLVGHTNGGSGLGLGQPIDGAILFVNNVEVDRVTYNNPGDNSYDVALDAISTVGNPSGAMLNSTAGFGPVIASPQSVVPEPSSLAVFGGLALAAGVVVSRRRPMMA